MVRQPYHAQRITSKAPYLHYQSPVNPRTAALTSAILGAGSRPPSKPAYEDMPRPVRAETVERKKHKANYYFHPSVDMPHVMPSGGGRVKLDVPVEGRLVPMAIPLGKPKTDPSLRLPLATLSPIVDAGEWEKPLWRWNNVLGSLS